MSESVTYISMRLVTSFFVPLTSILRLAAVRKERAERNGLLKERFEWFAAFCYSHWSSRPNDLIVEVKRSYSRWFVIVRIILRYYLRRKQRHFGYDLLSCSSGQESFSVVDNLYLEPRKEPPKNYKLESLKDSWVDRTTQDMWHCINILFWWFYCVIDWISCLLYTILCNWWCDNVIIVRL